MTGDPILLIIISLGPFRLRAYRLAARSGEFHAHNIYEHLQDGDLCATAELPALRANTLLVTENRTYLDLSLSATKCTKSVAES